MYILFMISLFLEGLLSNIIPFYSYISMLLLFTSIVLFYPYAKRNFKKYMIVIFIYGVLYDLIYTQALFLDGILFSVCIFLLHYLYKFFKTIPFSDFWLLILMILLYRSFGYFVLCMIGYLQFDVGIYIHSLLSSILFNVVYGILLYYILKVLYHKKILKQLI